MRIDTVQYYTFEGKEYKTRKEAVALFRQKEDEALKQAIRELCPGEFSEAQVSVLFCFIRSGATVLFRSMDYGN